MYTSLSISMYKYVNIKITYLLIVPHQPASVPNGLFELQGTGNETGTGTGMGTIENNGLLSLPHPCVVCTVHGVI